MGFRLISGIKKKLKGATTEQLTRISERCGDRIDFTDPDQLRVVESLLFQTEKEKAAKKHYMELHRDLNDIVSAALRENSEL